MAKQKRVNPARRPLSEAALKDAKARYTSAGLNVLTTEVGKVR